MSGSPSSVTTSGRAVPGRSVQGWTAVRGARPVEAEPLGSYYLDEIDAYICAQVHCDVVNFFYGLNRATLWTALQAEATGAVRTKGERAAMGPLGRTDDADAHIGSRIGDYLLCTLSKAEEFAVETHLLHCPGCSSECDQLSAVAVLVATLPPEVVDELIREGRLAPASDPGGVGALLAITPVPASGAEDSAELREDQA